MGKNLMEEEVKKVLPVALSEEEHLDRARQLAVILERRKEAEAEMKSSAAQFKDLLKSFDAEITRISEIVSDGAEPRMIACRWQLDFRTSTKSLVRQDTGEIVSTEPLSDAERQAALEFAPTEEMALHKSS